MEDKINAAADEITENLWFKEKNLLRTPLKTNMSPENQWLEDVFPIEINSPFLGEKILSFRGCKFESRKTQGSFKGAPRHLLWRDQT